MLLMMPLMSLWIGFIMPAAMGLYWIMNSVLGVVRDVVPHLHLQEADGQGGRQSA